MGRERERGEREREREREVIDSCCYLDNHNMGWGGGYVLFLF